MKCSFWLVFLVCGCSYPGTDGGSLDGADGIETADETTDVDVHDLDDVVPPPAIGAECSEAVACGDGLSCLVNFNGGYCGVCGCDGVSDCPSDSLCVRHDNTLTYCFRACETKAECNVERAAEGHTAANCTVNVVFVGGGSGRVCIPGTTAVPAECDAAP